MRKQNHTGHICADAQGCLGTGEKGTGIGTAIFIGPGTEPGRPGSIFFMNILAKYPKKCLILKLINAKDNFLIALLIDINIKEC